MTKSIVSVVFIAALTTAGCSSNSNSSSGADSPIGAVIGPPDDHCKASDGGLTIQTIGVCEVLDPTLVPPNGASCNVTFDEDAGAPAAQTIDAGAGNVSPYGPTMYGAAGNDDDCKYYVSWTATPIKENTDTFFILTATRLVDMMPATCAGVRPDVSFPADLTVVGSPPPANPSPEIAPGVYKVGPIQFSRAGIWQVRFHLFEECSDGADDSPHGHAAFYVQVP